MKKFSKKLLALLLVIAMLIPTGMMTVTTNAAESYITDLATSHVAYRGGGDLYYEDVATAKSLLANNGYSAVDYDLNQGIFGDFIYMGYKTDSNSNFAIRCIKIYKGSNPPSSMTAIVNGSTCTFYPVLDVEGYVYDLNANSNDGSPIYAYYTKDSSAGNPITSISFGDSKNGSCVTYFDSDSAANLNYKSALLNSDAIYMNYTTISDGTGDNTSGTLPGGGNDSSEDIPEVDASEKFEFNGHYYKAFDEKMLWTEAKAYCESIGGHLATITSDEENSFVSSLLDNDYYFLGGSDAGHEGIWEWVTGEEWDFSTWAPGEPNNSNNPSREQNILAIYGKKGAKPGLWDDSWNDANYFICEWESEGDLSGEHFPAGYNFKEDSYNFINDQYMTFGYKYYKSMYGAVKGLFLMNHTRNKQAVCFGMTYSVAALNNSYPYCDNIRGLDRESSLIKIGNNTIPLKDYIKYCHIYQFSSEFKKGTVWTSVDEIYDLVQSYADQNKIGVTIGITKKDGSAGHRLLALGTYGNKIIVDDPNNRDSFAYITIEDNGCWEFSGLSGWNSNTCKIRYNLDYYRPYQILSTAKTIHTEILNINNIEESITYFEGMDIFDKDMLLLYVDSDNYDINNSNISEICYDDLDAEQVSNHGTLYWVEDDTTVTISNINGNDNTIAVSGNESIIEIKTTDTSVVSITMDDNSEVAALIDTMTGNTCTLSHTSLDVNDNVLNVTLTGTANGDEVVASETEDGIQVTGLNDITVTYETADGTAETKADVKDGSTVNITVNDDENKIETDWQDKDETDEECKHSDSNHDGICDACSEDFTKGCSCNCHGNAFMQFLYKIATFFRRLFGMKQYQYCNCGKAHW